VGLRIAKIIVTGSLAPDEMVLHLVAAWLDKSDGSFLFDGFPRTVTQAERFEDLLGKRQLAIEIAILLEVSDPVIRARMLRRLTCSECGKVVSVGRQVHDANDPCPNCGGKLEARDDDNVGALAHRMQEYRDKTVPVADFYDRRDILARVDAGGAAEAVFKDVSQLIVG
jgi:adenylate kinase